MDITLKTEHISETIEKEVASITIIPKESIPKYTTNIITTTTPNIILKPSTFIPEKVDTTLLISPTNGITLASTQVENPIKTTTPYIHPTTTIPISANPILTTIPKIVPTTIIQNNPPQVYEKVLFILQVQIIDGKLVIFVITNFPITKDQKFTFTVSIYLFRNLRILQNDKKEIEITFSPKEDYDGNGDRVVSLISDNNFKEEKAVVEDLTNNKEIEVKILDNNVDVLDTQKVQETISKGGIDYSQISQDSKDHKIYQYKISSATNGCEFSLISENEINEENKNIELSFVEVRTNNHITANCLLSSKNNKNIVCSLDSDIDNEYILEPFIFSDKTETITILQKNTSDYLQLECSIKKHETRNYHSKRKSGLSTGAVVGIILGITFAVIITVMTIIFCKKRSGVVVRDNSTVANSFKVYESTSQKI